MLRIDCKDIEGGHEPRFAVTLGVNGPDISPRELIRARVEIEAERDEGYSALSRLVRPRRVSEQCGPRQWATQASIKQDAAAMVEIALQGFVKQAFLLLVNDRQATELDERLPLGETGEVIFLRLVPLKGG